jgi:predicted ferric reductase
MSRSTRVVVCLGVFIAVISAPIVILILQPGTEGRELWRELSVALGFAGMALMGLQFIPTARMSFVTNSFPVDTLYAFHHRISIAGIIMGLAHPLLLFIGNPYTIRLLNVVQAPWRARAAVAGILILIILVISSVWRLELKIKYEWWRMVHSLSAVTAAGLVLFHMFGVSNYMAYLPQRIYWIVMAVVWLSGAAYVRLLRPLILLFRPYRVVEVEARPDNCWRLVLEPDGHAGFRFKAGQFAWLTAQRSPFSWQENPFSFITSAEEREQVEFMIKQLGDFTQSIGELMPGDTVYVDGPFGSFDIEDHKAPGYVTIAGGIGITPTISILRTMADRGDDRHVLLIYANPRWEDVNFRDELEELKERVNLEVVHVLEEPPEDWDGEVGFVTTDMLDRHLPDGRAERGYFLCGPLPMISSVMSSLEELDIPMRHVHTEKYELA